MRTFSASLFVLLLLLIPIGAMAHTLSAPSTVNANPDGTFSYQWVFTAGPGSAFTAGSGWQGIQNVSDQLHGDCFCIPEGCTIQEGESISFPVEGSLDNPLLPGIVENWIAFCDEPDIRVNTTILPFVLSCAVNCPLGDDDGFQAAQNRSPDMNGDGVVNLIDLSQFAQAFPPNLYALCADFNCDLVINLLDLSTFAIHWGHMGPSPGVCD